MIIILIILILFQVVRIQAIENFEDVNPVVQIAERTKYLDVLKAETTDLEKKRDKLKEEIDGLTKENKELNNKIVEKKEEKLNLEANIAETKDTQENALLLIKNSLNETIKKEDELKLQELELKEEKDEKLNKIINKIQEIVVDKNTQFCNITKEIPEIKFKTYNSDEKDLAFEWCKCNDDNKNSDVCLNYQSCKDNYNNYKDYKSLSGDDLATYFNCRRLYPQFPNYLINNNQGIN